MRYRDLDTGTFLTRDPAGFKDGPNQYCYVHCNPITQFDAWGLETAKITTSVHWNRINYVQYPTKGDAEYADSAFVRDGKAYVTARDSTKNFLGQTVSDTGMGERLAKMNTFEARFFKTDKNGELVAKSVDEANDVSLKGPDLVEFCKEAGKHSDNVEAMAKVSVAAAMGPYMAAETVLGNTAVGMYWSATQQLMDDGKVEFGETVFAGVTSVFGGVVDEVVDAIPSPTDMPGQVMEESLRAGAKKIPLAFKKATEFVKDIFIPEDKSAELEEP